MLKKRLDSCLEVLVEKGHLSGSVADSVKYEYSQILEDSDVIKAMTALKRKERLDRFWMQILADSKKKSDSLNKFVRKILILSHGNASLERGFSVNAECVVVLHVASRGLSAPKRAQKFENRL